MGAYAELRAVLEAVATIMAQHQALKVRPLGTISMFLGKQAVWSACLATWSVRVFLRCLLGWWPRRQDPVSQLPCAGLPCVLCVGVQDVPVAALQQQRDKHFQETYNMRLGASAVRPL
jgi:hypothetical protein